MQASIALALLLLVFAILGGVAAMQWQQHEEVLDDVGRDVENLGQVIEAQVRGNVEAVNITLTGLAEALPLLPGTRHPGDDDIHALLRSRLTMLPFVRAIWVTDAAGDMVHDTDRLPGKFNFSQRAYFAAQRGSPGLGFYLGPPIVNAKGVWFMSASRRLQNIDGSFAGVVVAAIDPHYFDQFFATINVGKTGVVAMLTHESLLVARAPALAQRVGQVVGDMTPLRMALDQPAPPSLRRISPVDGVDRIFAYRQAGKLPLVIVVGRGVAEDLAAWRQASWAIALSALTLSALIAAMAYAVWRAMRRSEARTEDLAAVLDALPELMFEINLEGRIFAYRTQRHDLLAAPPEVFMGKLMSQVLSPDASAACMAAIHEAHLHGYSAGRQYALTMGQETKWFEASVARKATQVGRERRFIFLTRDITGRKATEAALRISTDLLEYSQEAAKVGGWELTLATGHLYWTAETYRIHETTPAEFNPTVEAGVSHFLPDSRRTITAALQAAMEQGIGYDLELETYTTKGSLISVRTTCVVSLQDGKPAKLTGIFQDITDAKKALNAVQTANRELARSNAELAQFAYVASHDLQEPLRSISSCVQLLKMRYHGQLDARADEFIVHAVGGAARMQTLIDDLLKYSRIGAAPRLLATVDSSTALQDATANLAAAIAQADARITHTALPRVNADAQQLTQLLQNLLANAIKFRGDKPAVVQVSARLDGAEWAFSVADQGIGIEPQYFGRIFGLFKRLHARDEYPGTGIGLTICKKIVEHHGGRIWVESVAGQGSTFFFTLPAQGQPDLGDSEVNAP